MHELSIAMSILELAAEESRRRGDARVERIFVRIGALSGVEKDALLGAFEIAREASEFPECRLEIEDVPVRIFCHTCNAERQIEQELRCSICGELSGELRSGREMEVRAMEIVE